MLRIVVATADESSRNLISRIVSRSSSARVVATTETAESLVRAVTYRRTNLAFVSADLDEMRGYAAAARLIRQQPKLHVVMLSPRGNGTDEILRAMKIGARECLAEPLAEDAVLRVLEDAQRDNGAMAERQGAIVPILSSQGGVGKSTIAVNLAIAFRRHPARVALVDGDLYFGDVAVLLDIKTERTMYELNASLDPEIAPRFLHKHSSGVEVLLAPRRRAEAASISPVRFREILRVLQGLYDLVIVDGPAPQLMPHTLDVSDAAIVVSTLEVVCLNQVRHMVNMLHRLPIPFDNVTLVGNFDDRRSLPQPDAEELLGIKFATILPRDDRNVVAGNQGTPLVLSNAGVPFAQKVVGLASILQERGGMALHAGV